MALVKQHIEPHINGNAHIAAGADAVLAASVFHNAELTVGQVKDALRSEGVMVR